MRNRILIVDDEPVISELICMNLEITGYVCDVSLDSDVTLTLLNKMQYNLVLLGIMLPGLDGFELLDHMQKYHIPVIYLTAKTDLSSKIKGLKQCCQ